jgi:hypothetical protein
MVSKALWQRVLFCLLLIWPWLAWAGATATAVTGTARLTPAKGNGEPLVVGQRIESGARVETGEGSGAVLRFDDGQVIALTANTNYRVDDFRFNPHKPEEGSFVSTLFRGALRAITGLIGESNKKGFAMKTETATIGIRGTDFNLHHDGQLYIQVIEGAVVAANSGGETVFDAAGQPLGIVASKTSPPRHAEPGELPAAVIANFRVLSSTPLTGRERAPNPSDPTCSSRR